MAEQLTIHAKGKLLITGEYFVLDGAKALAIPSKFGQSFEFSPTKAPTIVWNGYDYRNHCWLQETIALPLPEEALSVDSPRGRLLQVLRSVQSLNSTIFESGWQVTSRLEFPNNWGLGSSSTMIYAMAQWANVDPYELLQGTFGGSGYDIACAGANGPLLYTVERRGQLTTWTPKFSNQLYFVHLNQKQNSREGIRHYRKADFDKELVISELDALTNEIVDCLDLTTFEGLVTRHEALVGGVLGLPLVRERLFTDYWGAVKSLGAWGGDFVLVTSHRSNAETVEYFKKKGFATILKWQEMVD